MKKRRPASISATKAVNVKRKRGKKTEEGRGHLWDLVVI